MEVAEASLMKCYFHLGWLRNYFTAEEKLSVEGELKRNLVWSRRGDFCMALQRGGCEHGPESFISVCMNLIKNSVQ